MKESSRRREVTIGVGESHRWVQQRMRRRVSNSVPSVEVPGLDFDTLAQDLARGVSRRQILRRLVGAAAAGIAAPLFARLAFEPVPAAAATVALSWPLLQQQGGRLP